MAHDYTTPSIERSILLRMGFSSIEAAALVALVIDHDLMRKGAGHVVYRTATLQKMSVREAGLELIDGKYWEQVKESFGG